MSKMRNVGVLFALLLATACGVDPTWTPSPSAPPDGKTLIVKTGEWFNIVDGEGKGFECQVDGVTLPKVHCAQINGTVYPVRVTKCAESYTLVYQGYEGECQKSPVWIKPKGTSQIVISIPLGFKTYVFPGQLAR